MKATKRSVKTNHVGEHCDMLVSDFFAYYEGNPDNVKIIDIRDLKEPMPPTRESSARMLERCKEAWRCYCRFVKLPMECKNLFINRIKREWERRARLQSQKSEPSKATPNATS